MEREGRRGFLGGGREWYNNGGREERKKGLLENPEVRRPPNALDPAGKSASRRVVASGRVRREMAVRASRRH